MDRDIFKAFLQNTYLREGMSAQNEKTAANTLKGLVVPYIPQKLYRYRSVTDYSIDGFDQGAIWVTKPKKMNDLFDTRIGYNAKNIQEQILEDFSQLQKKKAENNPIAQSIFASMSAFGNKWKEKIQSELRTLSSDFQDEIYIACFSEEINSPSMWGNYADDNKGFALEYDFTISFPKEKDQEECVLVPVIYGEKPYDGTEFMRWYYWQVKLADMADNHLLTMQQYQTALSHSLCPDKLAVMKAMIYKSNKWKEEREWRLIKHKSPSDKGADYSHIYKKPVALYLGNKMEEKTQKKLEEIVRKKESSTGEKIPIYKMEVVPSTYKLRPRRIYPNG